MNTKVKTESIRYFVSLDENTYKALELMGVETDLIGIYILKDGEKIVPTQYKVVKKEGK